MITLFEGFYYQTKPQRPQMVSLLYLCERNLPGLLFLVIAFTRFIIKSIEILTLKFSVAPGTYLQSFEF